jgi:hypothetical protein
MKPLVSASGGRHGQESPGLQSEKERETTRTQPSSLLSSKGRGTSFFRFLKVGFLLAQSWVFTRLKLGFYLFYLKFEEYEFTLLQQDLFQATAAALVCLPYLPYSFAFWRIIRRSLRIH